MTTTPRLGAPDLASGQTVPETTVNEQIRIVEQSGNNFIVEDRATAPPGSPVDGDTYLIIATATGAWAGKENQLALYINTDWHYVTPVEGTRAFVQDENAWYQYTGAAWGTSGVGIAFELIVAVSDETTALTTGNAKTTFRMPRNVNLTDVRASVTTAPTGSTLIVDINESGSTILSTKLTIDAGEKTSTTASAPAVISDAALADDAEITIDIDQVGSTIAGAGLKVAFRGTRS